MLARTLVCLALVLAPHLVRAQPRPAPAIQAQVAELDAELRILQRNTRAYLGTWLAIDGALAGVQGAIALTSGRAPVFDNYLVGAGLSLAGIAALLIQRWPGFRAHDRFRALPQGTHQAELARIGYAEHALSQQRRWDRGAVTRGKHAIAALVAIGSGLRAGFSFDDTGQGLARGLAVLAVLELQIFTRPSAIRERRPRHALTLAPWGDGYAHGLALHGRF